LRELGDFLGAKRRQVAYEGRSSTRRRLVPGLSRDETATLADIGASWYARLEAGRIDQPTLDTVLAVCRALQLSAAETAYALNLAGLVLHLPAETPDNAFRPISALLLDAEPMAITLWDRYLFPIGWNAIAEAMHGFGEFPDPAARHPIAHLENQKIIDFFGEAHELYARNLVGMFRRVYASGVAPAAATTVYENARDVPIFRKYWDQHVVAESVTDPHVPFVRHHWLVGTYEATSTDLRLTGGEGFLRIVASADDASRSKFDLLRTMGRSSLDTFSLALAGPRS
jgi:transcriptional regulator with XRE-family HTH domain